MDRKIFPLRLLFMITDTGTEKRIDRLFTDMKLPVYYQFKGQGTAKTEILDICGMQGRSRLITLSVVPRQAVERIFERADTIFHMKKRGKGVAVTVPVTGIQERILELLKEEVSEQIKKTIESDVLKMKEESLYTMILTAVRAGYSDEVIDAAGKAGANGGSVIRARRQGNEEMVRFLGIPLQEELDLVVIIVRKEKKAAVMESIGSACGLKTEAKGIVVAAPIDAALGLQEGGRDL